MHSFISEMNLSFDLINIKDNSDRIESESKDRDAAL